MAETNRKKRYLLFNSKDVSELWVNLHLCTSKSTAAEVEQSALPVEGICSYLCSLILK